MLLVNTRPSDTELPKRARDLLTALHNRADEWMTRTELAAATGKRVLSPNDVNHLEDMTRSGLIEAEQRPGAVRPLWVYRAK